MQSTTTGPTAPRSASFLGLVPVLVAVLGLPVQVLSQSAPIFLDGRFGDWVGTLEFTDPTGDDGSSGVDFVQVDIANDDDFLFVRFQTSVEIRLQDGSTLALYIDTDDNPATGLAIGGVGAELEWHFGPKNGSFHHAAGTTSIRQDDIRLRQLPSVTASEFEIAIGRDVLPNGSDPLFIGNSIRLILLDTDPGGDRAPDGSGGIPYSIDPTPVGPPTPAPFAKSDAGDVRVVTWNTRSLASGSNFNIGVMPSADRVFDAIQPDIICFQEVYDPTASQTASYVSDLLPLLGPWYAAKQNDCVTVSRYLILQSWELDGNLAVLLDSDATLGVDLLLVNAHTPCCFWGDNGRQYESDHIMEFFRDAKTPGGIVDVPARTAFMIAGDLNLVGFSQQLTTLLTGDIVDEGTFGPDFDPDWDGSALADAISSQTEMRFAYTWRNDNSSFAPGRLDFLIYNDSVLEVGNQFLVYSPEMSAAELAATGIEAQDVTRVSDHLPHVADFRLAGCVVGVGPTPVPDLTIRSQIGRGEIRFWLELGFDAAVEIEVFDIRGRRVRSLFAGRRDLAPGRHALRWDGRDDHGGIAASGMYVARARAAGSVGKQNARAKWILLR